MNLTEKLAHDINLSVMIKLSAVVKNPMGGKAEGSAVKAPKTSPMMMPTINDLLPKVTTVNNAGGQLQPIQPIPTTQSGIANPPMIPMFS